VSYGRSYGGSGSRGFRGPPGPAPVEVGKEYELEVTEVSKQGDGVARVQGFVIFVKRGTVGQKATVKIDQIGNRFAIGTIVS
jgi:predicted RNA-binding protein with TRAM domain